MMTQSGSEVPPYLSLPLDPELSTRARQLHEINPEFCSVLEALKELGEDRRGAEGWLKILTALVQVWCSTSEAVSKEILSLDTKASHILRAALVAEAPFLAGAGAGVGVALAAGHQLSRGFSAGAVLTLPPEFVLPPREEGEDGARAGSVALDAGSRVGGD
ncbi:unnamed protein product, partial [Choristocarpus tenellus]